MPQDNQAPAFDPNASYQSAPSAAPPFDPNAPYQAAQKPTSVAPVSDSNIPGAPAGLPGVPNATSPQMQTLATPSTVASQAWGAVKQHAPQVVAGVGQPVVTDVETSLTPPQSAREHAIAGIGGPGALIAYRSGKRIVDSAENLFKARQQDYEQAKKDFAQIADEYHNGDYRNALSTAGDIAADIGGRNAELVRGREVAEGARPGGDVVTPITKDAIDALALLIGKEKAPEAADAAEGAAGVAKSAAGNVIEAVKHPVETVKNIGEDIKPAWLTKRPETGAPQHGAPVRVESPLDSATVGTKLGGKDLSQEALDTLQGHVTGKIPVGGTAKGQLMKAVEPVTRTINDTASKMNDVVRDAPKFTTSVMQDSVFGEGGLTSAVEKIKSDLPPSVREGLSADVDAVMEDADKALNSNNPAEVLEYRRQLGKKIDWDAIEKNPSTPAEAQNLARVKVYQAIGNKIHAEIPETVELDKTLQPNLELRSHMQRKLGERVVDDPHAATVEAQSELKKGKDALDVAQHNERVQKNWGRIKTGLIALGVGGGIIHEIEKFLP